MKRDTEKMFATMKPWKLFFIVALPGMVSMFAMSIYSIIEGAFIGQKLGEGALAAINIAMPLVLINFSLADLIGVGASVPISIALGKKDKDTANNVFSCSIVMIFIASVIMGTVMYFAAEPLCRLMGQTMPYWTPRLDILAPSHFAVRFPPYSLRWITICVSADL